MSALPAVEFQQVSNAFGGRKVLNEVSFQVPEGEALCILGRSGTGKSVTLKLMIGLLKPDSGTVYIANENISQSTGENLSRVRRHIGFLFQSAALFDSFTLRDNLALPLRRFEKDKSAEEIQQIVQETLDHVGLGKDLDKLPAELSGGMRKRAGLVKAIALNPRLLLVDEPSSGLDRITAAEIDELLLKIKKERHTTMVIVTHDVHGARKVGDKIAVLDQGCLVSFGTVDQVEKSDNKVARELISESSL